jgi:lipopolysaccharide export system permease protein
MMGKIWERYFLKQTLKVFTLILGCFYGLYVLIDYASRSSSQNHFHSKFHFSELLQYYFFEFIQRMDVLLPFALLIATIRTLTLLNIQNELVALLAGGIKMKTLLRPFILLGLVCVAIVYANSQYMIPYALQEMRHIRDVHSFQKNNKKKKIIVQSVPLKNHSMLLFQDYDGVKELFFDAYWIKSFDQIYHMKYLSPKSKPPVGTFVDLIERNSDGKMVKVASYDTKTFTDLRFNKKVLLDTITPPDELSISKLWQKLPSKGAPSSEKEAQLSAAFYQKLVAPWFCLIAILGPAPLCVRFSRYFPVFFIYGLSIFGLAACYIVLDASVVIGGRQVTSPFWAILSPFIIVQGLVFWNYFRMK